MIVADNALISYLIIPGEYTDEAERVRGLDSDWVAPPLWISEFRNVLRNYIVGGLLSLEKASLFMDAAELLMRGRAHDVSSAEVLALAATSGCTAYDCEYVALARSVGVQLITTDKEVLREFPDLALHPERFGA